MELLEIMKARRSVRQYTGAPVPEEKLELVLAAGLYAPSGRGRRPWEFIVVRDKEMLQTLSVCRPHGPGMLAGADCAIVVLGDTTKTDVWVEDCAIAMTQMHLMADSLALGSCWVQCRLRHAPDGRSTTEYLREHLDFPETMEAEAILALGIPADHPAPHTPEELPFGQVHKERFSPRSEG